MITSFKDKNYKSKKKYRKNKKLTTKLKSSDTFVIIATTSSFFRLSHTGIGFYGDTDLDWSSVWFSKY